MICTKKAVTLAAALCAIPMSSALSAVTFTSRLSTASASQSSGGAPTDYSESGSYNQIGANTITLPHGFSHQSTVTNSGVSGTWRGSYDENGVSHFATRTKSTLDALFTVGAPGIKATISLSGSANNILLDPGSNPLLQNAYFVITDTATNAVVFDAFAFGVQTVNIPDNYSQVVWSNVVKQVNLAAGNYRLQVGADGDVSRHAGPGGGWSGQGHLTTSMTFSAIPAPASAMAFAGVFAVGIRRKR